MIETKYIPQDNAEVIYRLLELCKEKEPNVCFDVLDTEEQVCKSKDSERVLNDIDGGDEDIGINCFVNGEYLGWFGLFPYEDPESMIYDYSDNEFCKDVYYKLEKEMKW